MDSRKKIKKALSSFLGLSNVVLFSSCRNALYTLLLSLKLKPGDEVIIQQFICSTLPIAIARAGGTPVFAEINGDTFNLDPTSVKKNITSRTRVVLFVHTYGNPSGIEEIRNLCSKYNLILIEDIAQALGASYKQKPAGTFGDYAVSSFTKQIINIGGGAVISNHNLSDVEHLQRELEKKGTVQLTEYFKRLITSLYEARAFFFSKILIDIASKKMPLLKVALTLDSHFTCSKIEAYLAFMQIKSLQKKIIRRKLNYEYLKTYVETQKISPFAESSHLYLTFRLPNKKAQENIVANNFLFLPPWRGTSLSEKLVFIPNNPSFTLRKLDKFIKSYHKVFK